MTTARISSSLATAVVAALTTVAPARAAVTCTRTITADVVAFDQPIMFNRLGAQNVNGMMYALRRDVVHVHTQVPLTVDPSGAVPGAVGLRPDKRPRPIVLRVAEGDCLRVNFQNLLDPNAGPKGGPRSVPPGGFLDFLGHLFNLQVNDQVATRVAGFRAQGLQLVGSMGDDGSFVGKNASSLVAPGGSRTYTLFAEREGGYLVTSEGATFGGEGTQGHAGLGLIGAVNVQPRGAAFFRSQVTEEELRLATVDRTADDHPVIDYDAVYPNRQPWIAEGKAGLPVLKMTRGDELVHSDLDAIIAYANAGGTYGPFPTSTYPLENKGYRNPTYPNRLEPYRELSSIWHDEVGASQVFPAWYRDPVVGHLLHGVRDAFMINYGSGGIGSEIIANRLGVGPMHDCLTCAYEEFFLTSFTVGDPAQLVDVPANVGLEACDPALNNCTATGPKAEKGLYPHDPANVHHSYIGDFVKFRNVHASKEQHVFHLHNHQWLFNSNDDNSNYIDAQGIGPGSSYTYEIAFGGSGNRNKTAGDAIFHCHFYPHFAMGMWYLWRVHDTFEAGTLLEVSGGAGSLHTTAFAEQDGTPAAVAHDAEGKPTARYRSLPDGEVLNGIAQPAVVPLPGKAMAPMPGEVHVVRRDANGDGIAESSQAKVIDRSVNPGFPYWIGGIESVVGQRPPTPPLDMLTEAKARELTATDPFYKQFAALYPDYPTRLEKSAGGWDGGLPRHALDGFAAGGAAVSIQTRLDMTKVITSARPVYFPEEGTDVEKTAMLFHSRRAHPTFTPDGTPAEFRTNGAPPVASAPFMDPCVDDAGNPVLPTAAPQFFSSGGLGFTGKVEFGADNPRVYKGANVQIDAVLNKAGYHNSQQRIIALWEDVRPFIEKQKPPEPFVIRFNTFDCGKYLHTNLVPSVYELDDYQVRTPTDIIGQHIHLPKWDLTTTDGAANGWNYEDGTLAPAAVQERIHAINHFNADPAHTPVPTLDGRTRLEALPHPFFGVGAPSPVAPDGVEYRGARTTIQRWFFDPVVNVQGQDRGLGIIFTHDHYGPSTHQQIGLYATVLTEPAGSRWVHNETGAPLHTRPDGGPTSWQAAILTPNRAESFREFWFQMTDFQHAYEQGVYVGAGPDGRPNPAAFPATSETFRHALNPPVREQIDPTFPYPDLILHKAVCPGGVPRPCPEAITVSDPGLLVMNYRQEPVGIRVYDPNRVAVDGKKGAQAAGLAGDLAFALQTRTDRAIPALNTALGDTPYPPLTGDIRPGDPFTPIMRAFAGDRIRVKVQTGGQEEEHHFSMHGVKWLQGGSGHGSAKNSGWRNAQAQGISEQFTFSTPIVMDPSRVLGGATDFLYAGGTSQDAFWSGEWGILRTYHQPRADLFKLPNTIVPYQVGNSTLFRETCPITAPVRRYDVTAVLANQALPAVAGVTAFDDGDPAFTLHAGAKLAANGRTLVYNPRRTAIPLQEVRDEQTGQLLFTRGGHAGPLHDPSAVVWVRTSDLNLDGTLRPGVTPEPLVLRAAAGECIEVTMRNRLPALLPDAANLNTLIGAVNRDRQRPDGVTTFNNNLVVPSSHVGLHPQLVTYDANVADGSNVGVNPVQTVAPGGVKTVRWYAGDVDFGLNVAGPLVTAVTFKATPVEFGGSNLIPADKVKQGQKGLVGTLIVEPAGSRWVEDARRASATVTPPLPGKPFRDFAVVIQKHASMRYADGAAVENVGAEEGAGVAEDTQDGGQSAINYGSEPLWFRFGLPPNAPLGNAPGGFGAVEHAWMAYSNDLAGGADPATPVLTAKAGQPFRMHLVEPHGAFRGSTFDLHGHVWQRDPYVCPGSSSLGLAGKCEQTEVGSRALGTNPLGKWLGGQESIQPYGHFEIVLDSAGGKGAVPGDYLFRDHGAFGNTMGLWGILRVE